MSYVPYLKAIKIMLKSNCVLEQAIPRIFHIHNKKSRKALADR